MFRAHTLTPPTPFRIIVALKISVSGIRGVIGDGLDAESVTRFAAAYGSWLAPGAVVVARDSRPSGPMLVHAVTAALLSTGHDVVDAGLLTTPSTEMLVQETDAVGGIIVTASHNSVAWNALKLLRGDGLFLSAEDMSAVQAAAEGESRAHRGALALGTRRTDERGEQLHLHAILASPFLDLAAIRQARLKVVVDAVEGAGGRALPALLQLLGVECIAMYCGSSGIFPHDPEPRPEHLVELAERVREEGADLGLAVDPDVDRLALVDRGGIAISEESTLGIAADFVLGQRTGPMVVNLSTTMALDAVARRHGVRLERTPVGEANVVARMLQIGAVIGGEGNGGVILPSLHPGRDALLGAALVLAAVAARGSLRACLERLPPAHMQKDKLELTSRIDSPQLWERALAQVGRGGSLDRSDGLKYALADRWIHLRRSNTEPALRIIAEAPDAETAKAMIEQVRKALEA